MISVDKVFFVVGYILALIFGLIYGEDLRVIALLFIIQNTLLILNWTILLLIYSFKGKYKEKTKIIPFAESIKSIVTSAIFFGLFLVFCPYVAFKDVIASIPSIDAQLVWISTISFSLGLILTMLSYTKDINKYFISYEIILREVGGLYRLALMIFLIGAILWLTDEGKSSGSKLGYILVLTSLSAIEYFFDYSKRALEPLLLKIKTQQNLWLDNELRLRNEKNEIISPNQND